MGKIKKERILQIINLLAIVYFSIYPNEQSLKEEIEKIEEELKE